MKVLINENQESELNRLMRRLRLVDDIIDEEIEGIVDVNDICPYEPKDFYQWVFERIERRLYFLHFEDINVEDEIWDKMSKIIKNYVYTAHMAKMEKVYKYYTQDCD